MLKHIEIVVQDSSKSTGISGKMEGENTMKGVPCSCADFSLDITVAESPTDSALAGSQTNEDCIFPFLKFYFNHLTIQSTAHNSQFRTQFVLIQSVLHYNGTKVFLVLVAQQVLSPQSRVQPALL